MKAMLPKTQALYLCDTVDMNTEPKMLWAIFDAALGAEESRVETDAHYWVEVVDETRRELDRRNS